MVAAVLAMSDFAAGADSATAASGTVIAAVTISADRVDLSGTQAASVTVVVRLQDATGVYPAEGVVARDHKTTQCPCARLDTVAADGTIKAGPAQSLNERFVRLALTSGTPQDGFWAGTTRVSAINSGRWQLTALIAGTLQGPPPGNTGNEWSGVTGDAYGAGVQITGRHWPVLSITSPSRPVPFGSSYRLTGKAVYVDTRAPVPGLRLGVTARSTTGPYDGAEATVTTDRVGEWTLYRKDPSDHVEIRFGPESVTDNYNVGPTRVLTQWSSSATATTYTVHWNVALTVTRAGSTRYLNTQLAPRFANRVQLQRKTSSGWLVLIARTTSNTGSFRFSTHTPGIYRVRSYQYPHLLAPYTSIAVRVT